MEKYCFSDAERKLMENSIVPFAIYQFIDKKVVTIVLTKGMCELFGYDDMAEAYYDMDNDMYKDVHMDDAARISEAAYKFATEDGIYDVVYRSKNPAGSGYSIIHAQGKHFYTEEGVRLAQIWYTNEGSFSEESADFAPTLTQSLKNALHEESLFKASYYDHLTALPSMTYFFELASAKRKEILESGNEPALLYMDFSGMKYFNHKFGFAEGDKLLQAFSRTIAARFGNESCGRLGQDHFTVITKAEGLEDQIRELFDECKNINNGQSLPLHVGIYLHSYEGVAPSMACDRAKFACDMLKNLYSSEFKYYEMKMKDTEDRHQYVIANIDKAIEEHWITVYFQPIIRAVNGRVCDEEALARWIDPVMGFMSPADFIPVLEDHKLIYKLDLFVLECVLKKIKVLEKANLSIVPQSINLSRSDFDCCDIVEEIRKRVDDAGISRSLITIEITESVIAKDFEFMKAQIDRFREYGFAVWMDDFGSGYSSLDVLQSIKFDLIKFDMRFMQKFNDGTRGKIILTELINMATSLGIGTICEGVETQDQTTFLKETGCSKLQGFHFDKPIPVEKILEKYEKGLQIGFENPEESGYYEAVGQINLRDLSVISKDTSGEFDNFFNTMPMAIIEVNNGKVRFARSSTSYRDFMFRNFGFMINDKPEPFYNRADAMASPFMKALLKAENYDGNLFLEEKLPNNGVVHSCMRRVARNPVTGTYAAAVAVLSVSYSDKGTTYANIAKALAADYFNLYYVDIETENFFEYSADAIGEELSVQRKGENFFHASRKDALERIYHEDTEKFRRFFRKDNILRQLDEQGLFVMTYRLLIKGEPVFVVMKGTRMPDDPKHIIIGVSNVDAQLRQKMLLDKARQNEVVFSRIMALSGDYLCLYIVDPKTDKYIEYAASDDYKTLGLLPEGSDFFGASLEQSKNKICEEDRDGFLKIFTKQNVLDEISRKGFFVTNHRLMIEDSLLPVTLKAALVREYDGEKIIIGVYKRKSENE